MWEWVKVLAVLFVLPVFSAGFFFYAPQLEDKQVHQQFVEAINKSEVAADVKAERLQFVSELNFVKLCADPSADAHEMAGKLGVNDVCNEMEQFHWAQLGSLVLIALAALHLLLTFVLSRSARGSRTSLLNSFRTGWTTATLFTLIILLGQTALAAYSFFYLTVLFTGSYFPKLILAVIIAGVWAFWQIARSLLRSVPIEPVEKTSEEVSEESAPALWAAVRDTASKLGTAAPDTILLGMTTSFYVTEFPVRHAKGISRVRTLHLSAPLMQKMPKEEILAIIGHELGHFKGDDTLLTRQLTPLLMKSEITMAHLFQAGLVARPALHAIHVFKFLFESVISAYRRDRELHADAAGAAVTDNHTAALALVRYCYQAEVLDAALNEHLRENSAMEASLAKFEDLLGRDDRFWTALAAHGMPHPFDSHPPLALRLEKLGYKADDLRYLAVKAMPVSAFDTLLKGKADVIRNAAEEHSNLLRQAREQIVAIESKENMPVEMIEKHFPQVTLKASKARVGLVCFIILAIGLFVPGVMLLNLKTPTERGIAYLVMAASLALAWKYWSWQMPQTLTINHLGIQLSNWREMLKFEDVKQIQHMVTNGTHVIHFHLKEKRPPLAKNPWFKWARAAEQVSFASFQGKQQEHVERVFRYYQKQLQA